MWIFVLAERGASHQDNTIQERTQRRSMAEIASRISAGLTPSPETRRSFLKAGAITTAVWVLSNLYRDISCPHELVPHNATVASLGKNACPIYGVVKPDGGMSVLEPSTTIWNPFPYAAFLKHQGDINSNGQAFDSNGKLQDFIGQELRRAG
jgi:hypothetical protein